MFHYRSATLVVFAGFVACSAELPTSPKQVQRSAIAETVPGTRHRAAVVIDEVTPPCSNPAPLIRKGIPVAGYLVRFQDDADAKAMASALGSKYGFKPLVVWNPPVPGFYAVFSAQVLAAIRCEPGVVSTEENGLYYTIVPPH